MNAVYTSSGWNTHNEVDLPRITRPIDRLSSHFIVVRTLEGPKATLSLPALNSTDSEYTSHYLVKIGDIVPTDGGCVRYELTYSNVPAQIIDYESYSYTFPGISNSRRPIDRTITSKVTSDFFLCATGQTYSTPDLVPVYFGQTYTYAWSGAAADYLSGSSVPTSTDYLAWVAADEASPASYSIEAEDSIIEQYIGDIYRRTRRHIKAR